MTEAFVVPIDLIVLTYDVRSLIIQDSNSTEFQQAVESAFQLSNDAEFQQAVADHDKGIRACLGNSLPSSTPFISDIFSERTHAIAARMGLDVDPGIKTNAMIAVRAARVINEPRTNFFKAQLQMPSYISS